MTTSITIRDVPDETRDELAARAAATGRSLQEYLRSKLIDLARQPDAPIRLTKLDERTREAQIQHAKQIREMDTARAEFVLTENELVSRLLLYHSVNESPLPVRRLSHAG